MTSNTTCIRLDWDDISFNECKRRISTIMKSSLVQALELRSSVTSGFHIIVSIKTPEGFLTSSYIHRLRRIWKDDGNRLVKDILDSGCHRDVMFRYKVIAGTTWSEEPICTYTRIRQSDTWKIKPVSRQSVPLELLS